MDSAHDATSGLPHSSHWGAFTASWRGEELAITPHPRDPDPNALLQNFPAALRHRARIARPMVRTGWLDNGPGASDRRGRDSFVAMEWDAVLDLLASELRRVRDTHGPGAVFGGSYGWASAGRFHHAQSQVHRFLNKAIGGYVRSVHSYSAAAALAILPHVFGSYDVVGAHCVTWDQIVEHTEIVLSFGGMAIKNSMIANGGISRHTERGSMQAAHARGCAFLLVSPLQNDLPDEAGAEWIAPIPGTDTALMLGVLHTLVAENLHDKAFLGRNCVGWPVFEAYLTGRTDGVPKDAAWAASIVGLPADTITSLAHRLVGKRVVVTVAHSLQRAEHGEQPVWLAGVLAAALGQIGLPGGGYAYALGAVARYGRVKNIVPSPSLPQGQNAVRSFIPVARIADMLLHPGASFDFNGERLFYPDIRLVYWAGGNPFHHHQDLNRLRRAFATVETLVVHDLAWTATARHADIVLPATMTLEREDIGTTETDPLVVAMHRIAEPFGQARDDYAIFSELAERLGCGEEFTEGRSARAWVAHLYENLRSSLARRDVTAPDFETFWAHGELLLPSSPDDGGILRAFRVDPEQTKLPTPSGRIEIFSETIANFGYADCPGHPAWLPPMDVPGPDSPLHLVANQPATKLHSQLDFGDHSLSGKHRGREVLCIHPADAASRGIGEGAIVRLFNARGACLAAAHVSDQIRPGVVQLPTGAWYDPDDPDSDQPLCVHGNPNVLTRDVGTSSLGQGCTGQLTTVQVELFAGNLPPIKAFDPP